jgi:hypothetical protein
MAREAGFNWPEIHTTTVEERLERFFRSAYATGAADERDRVAALASNARLFTKAPDLRDALQNLLTAIHHRENNPGFASAGNYVRALERARALLED